MYKAAGSGALWLWSMVYLVGCTAPAADPAQLAAARQQVLLASEPEGAVGVLDLRENLAAGQQQEVVLVGQIGGVANPWTRGEASFVLADPASLEEAQAHDHHACGDDCPYCKKQKEESASGLALVQLVDESGRVLPLDAQDLLQAAAEDTVVVAGQASITADGHLVVAAHGVYVRR